MQQWNSVTPATLFGMTVKMYRTPYEPQKTISIPNQNKELDHYAFDYLGSELYMYKILDSNFIQFMEERGDVSRLKNILIPITDRGIE